MRRKIQTALAACVVLLALAGLALAGCATTQSQTIHSEKSALELRTMQSRIFETGDTARVYRAVLATMQDLGYTITKLEPNAGTVTGDKLAQLTMTVTVYRRGTERSIVRANAIVKTQPQEHRAHQVDAPEFYQQRLFEPLSKALFLTAQDVDTDEELAPAGEQDVAGDGLDRSG